MKKKRLNQLKKQATLCYTIGIILMVWMIVLSVVVYRETNATWVKDMEYSSYEREILALVEKQSNLENCDYYVKTKNYDGTYTVAVTKSNEVAIMCYYVVNPTSKTIAYYDN